MRESEVFSDDGQSWCGVQVRGCGGAVPEGGGDGAGQAGHVRHQGEGGQHGEEEESQDRQSNSGGFYSTWDNYYRRYVTSKLVS